MKKKKDSSFEDIRKSIEEAIANSTTMKHLENLRESISTSLENRTKELMKEQNLVKKVKYPKFNWKHLVSIPFIYGMIIPSVFLHICAEIYQQVRFRLYDIPRVKAKEYFIYDRELLSLLTPFQKFNCIYCSYVNNLFSFVTEIGARTERYWCPIKYHRKLERQHSQYDKFISEEDTEEERLEKLEKLEDFSDIAK